MKKFHYVYKILNVSNNMCYIGSRSSILEPGKDLGYTYLSSSLDKNFINDQKTNRENYRYEILKIFTSRIDADEYESMLHEQYDVDKNPMFYNRAKQTSTKFRYDPTGIKHSDERKSNISKALLGRHVSDETKQKLRVANLGKKLTDECKKKLSEARKGTPHSEETKNKMSITRKKFVGKLSPTYGMKHKRVECPHCKKNISINTYGQWHGDNCKQKNNLI